MNIQEQETQVEREAKLTSQYKNAIVVANILELSVSVLSKIATDDLARQIDGDTVTKSVLLNIAANRIRNKVLNTQGA